MADSTEGDTGIQYLGLLATALIALIAGLVIHSFIIGVNVTDWWKGRPVTPVDHIVTSLVISRMGTQCAITLYFLFNTPFLSSLDTHVDQIIIMSVYALFSYANFWLTSLLSIVFCLKISNFHIRLFLYLRGMILHRTAYCIVAAVLLSLNGLNPLLSISKVTRNGTYNTTIASLFTDYLYMHSIYNVIIGVIFPLLFYWISSVLLFTSLYHHTTKMKMSSNLSINLETYYSVMKFVSFTFVYNTVYLIGHLANLLYYYFHCVSPLWLCIILDFLPVLHSSYLIYKTAKLRTQMCKVLQNVTDLLLQRKSREIRENIEVADQ